MKFFLGLWVLITLIFLVAVGLAAWVAFGLFLIHWAHDLNNWLSVPLVLCAILWYALGISTVLLRKDG